MADHIWVVAAAILTTEHDLTVKLLTERIRETGLAKLDGRSPDKTVRSIVDHFHSDEFESRIPGRYRVKEHVKKYPGVVTAITAIQKQRQLIEENTRLKGKLATISKISNLKIKA